jgi:hypothetical protein
VSEQGSLATEALTGDPFVVAIHARLTGVFEGTAAALLDEVTPDDDKRRPKDWPANARAVTQRLRRQAPAMRKAGWTIDEDSGKNKAGVVQWTIACPPEKGSNPSLPDPPPRHRDPEAGQAGKAGNEPGPSPDAAAVCCGRFTDRGAPLVLSCQVCAESPTYWRRSAA